MFQLFKKTPLAWLQVTREKTRLAIALAGIAFADILMFVQLGFKDSLYESAVKPHYALQADLILLNTQFETFFAVKSFARERLYQASGFEGVESISPLYISAGQWRNPENRTSRTILIFGIDPQKPAFNMPEVLQNLNQIKLLDRVLFDEASRPEYGAIADILKKEGRVETEVNQRHIQVSGLVKIGASFAADGNVIASDSTFMHIFPERRPDRVEVGLINLKPGVEAKQVQLAMQAIFPADVKVLTLKEFAELEKTYWENSTPIGFVFGLGTIVGFIVGIVIVYQILYSDVSDHLPEYATLKAMGYTDGYLIVVLLQEAIVLAALGFVPGFFLSIGLYSLAQAATLLPIGMTANRAITVLVLTAIMCTASGVVAMRKLQAADPADIF